MKKIILSLCILILAECAIAQDKLIECLNKLSTSKEIGIDSSTPFTYLNVAYNTDLLQSERLPESVKASYLLEYQGKWEQAKAILNHFITQEAFCRMDIQSQYYLQLKLIQLQIQVNAFSLAHVGLNELMSEVKSSNSPLSVINSLIALKLQTILNYNKTNDTAWIQSFELTLNQIVPKLYPEHAEWITCQLKLAELFRDQNQMERALYTLLVTQKRFETYFEKNPIEKYHLQIGLASSYQALQNYDSAKSQLLAAEATCTQVFGLNSIAFLQLSKIQAKLYRELGDLNQCENILTNAIKIAKENNLVHSIVYNSIVCSLASLNNSFGKREIAETLAMDAKLNFESNAMMNGPEYIQCLEILATICYNEKRWDEAEVLLIKSNILRQQLYGLSHYTIAENLSRLGSLYLMKEQFAKAESLYIKAISLSTNKNHEMKFPFISINLGLLYTRTGQYEKAEKTLLQVKNYYETHFGNYNKTYLWILDNLAELYTNMKQYDKATQLFVEASKLRKQIIYDSFKYLAPTEVDGFIKTFKRGINLFNAFLLNCPKPEKALLVEAYDNELFYKGFSLNYQQEIQRLVGKYKIHQELYDSIKYYCKLSIKEFLNQTPNKDYITSINKTIEALEQRLCKNLSGYERFTKNVHFSEIKSKLNTGESVVEISLINTSNDLKVDSLQFIAFVFNANSVTPVMIKLGSEYKFTQFFPKNEILKADYVNAVYSVAARGFEPIQEANGNYLFQFLIQPLLPSLKNVQTIYYAPTGGLHKINIQAIPTADTKVFGQNYQVIQLASSRDLMHIHTKASPLKNAQLFGGINYMEKDTATNNQPTLQGALASRSMPAFKSNKSNASEWPDLKHTQTEVTLISNLLKKSSVKVNAYLGSKATEAQFNKLGQGKKSPDIIHLATHGYFISLEQLNKLSNTKDSFQAIKKMPMMRSGLLLANGYNAWKSGPQEFLNTNDGVLTALEVSQMDLSNTKLVVLSACETGLGDINGNEGVLGLQRAFQIAGVDKIIMSLWEVPDFQTQELMQQFYHYWITKKYDIPTAFTKAQMGLKEKYGNPYFWAGFILVNY
ncbi:MAG: CHAT domain-containing protein [Saprospiraceae bacterium]|nr:CHAT domain-containing protein [Saprospiraceae bacterium]